MGRINYDLIGQKFTRLTVIGKVDSYISPNGAKKIKWLCKCDCGNEVEVTTSSLISGGTKSCGCLRSEATIKRNKEGKKYNTYDLSNEYGIGYTSKGEPFYFDLEDYDLIKDYCWYIIKGYLVTSINNHTTGMHRIIVDAPKDKFVDHINHDTHDNRKSNLRICTPFQNIANSQINKKNKLGVKGVYERPNGRYTAYISENGKKHWLGTYDTIKEAADIYDAKAKEYFGEFAYLNNYQGNE